MQAAFPFKWKLFRILSYLQAGAALCFLGFVAIHINEFYLDKPYKLLQFILFVLGFIMLLSNACINLFWLERYFPNNLPGKVAIKLSIVLFIFSIIFTVVVTSLNTIQFLLFIEGEEINVDGENIFITICAAIITLVAVPVFILQVSLRKLLNRNYHQTFEQFLKPDDLL